MGKIGPLNGWWVSGYREGQKVTTGESSQKAHYYLVQPTEAYAKIIYPSKSDLFHGMFGEKKLEICLFTKAMLKKPTE